MAINNEELRQGFRSLSTRYGGSLLKKKQLLKQEEVVVFIGLGGLGGRAVNAIKAAASEKLDNPDRRFFLAVDTCERDMDNISVVTKVDIEDPEQAMLRAHGCIEENEKLPLYRENFKIKILGHDVDSWLNRDQLNEVEVDNSGAQGIRQIGRVMLMANGNYERVYNSLKSVLDAARLKAETNNTGMKIYIVAGISGGTGSGTIVDFTYMVRRAISGYANRYKKIDSIIFTPDVQFNDDGVDDTKKKGLKANFYAAIKEIDFFYNNYAKGVKYECPYTADEAAYAEDIFDSCTLVSRRAQGVDIARNSNEVIKIVADALTFEMSNVTGTSLANSAQSYSAFFSNIHDNFNKWWPDNSNGKGLDMPDWAPARYSSLAYSSFYIPRDELVAYCANLLMEKLANQWKEQDITQKELDGIFAKYSIVTNKVFAGKLFDMSKCSEFFEVQKSKLPFDGFGPIRVKNCISYLDRMQSTAEEEGSTQIINMRLKDVGGKKLQETFVNPIISLVDKAFTDEKKGPVYAINLLSAGTSGRYSGKQGVLAHINKLVAELADDVKTWESELEQVYDGLLKKAEEYENQVSIAADDLNTFTNDCRKYGEDLLKCKLLKNAKGYLSEIYNALNEKNNKVFSIYTYTVEYLIEALKEDSAYVASTTRSREGQITVFSFDLANFNDGDRNSDRFKAYFKSLVDNKNLTNVSKKFIDIIFGTLKERLDPAVGTGKNKEITPDEVVDTVRKFFMKSFPEFTDEVIEKFCVVAFSDVEASAERITEIWENEQLKATALQAAAAAIQAKIMENRRIMLTCADASRDLQNFCSYETFAVLPNTKDINRYINCSKSPLQAEWSEFIGFKRIFGFPLSLLADMGEYKKHYDAQAGTPGIHLDEMFGEEEDFGDWRYSLPEPYSYTAAKFLGKYVEGGNDTAETDRQHMERLLKLTKRAKELGLLIQKTNGNQKVDIDGASHAEAGLTYYELVWALTKNIGNIPEKRSEIRDNIRSAVEECVAQKRELDFFEILSVAGYKPAEATKIQWTFTRPQYNVMQNRTAMGDDVDFGNFIVLLRSSPYWEAMLKKAVALFGELRAVYDTVIAEFAAAAKYDERVKNFIKAIRVARIVPFYDNGLFTGYKIKVTDKDEEAVFFNNLGMERFDQKFLVYNCFADAYFNLGPAEYDAMNTLAEHDFSLERRVDYSQEALDNVQWFIAQADAVFGDKDLLAHYDEATMKKNFVDGLKFSKFSYSLPVPSNGKEDVDAVVENIRAFYTLLKEKLQENLPEENIAAAPAETSAPAAVSDTANAWTCTCGTKNTGKFCANCGTKKPESDGGSWTCPSCGKSGNTGNFCANCGARKPESDDNGWTCPSCGKSGNTGNFCANCGTKKAENGDNSWFCPNCGSKNTGNFCAGCGRRKDS